MGNAGYTIYIFSNPLTCVCWCKKKPPCILELEQEGNYFFSVWAPMSPNHGAAEVFVSGEYDRITSWDLLNPMGLVLSKINNSFQTPLTINSSQFPRTGLSWTTNRLHSAFCWRLGRFTGHAHVRLALKFHGLKPRKMRNVPILASQNLSLTAEEVSKSQLAHLK